ncbi:unnamed protein product [Linum tenue]|uniref:FLZ-type domain-containing protein n=1 Tax=Linum tenue TaxID=586396 RepID=A0AAV0MCZ6_9ROSI|nr:unnamed protein product [Linum tenue]
MLRKRTRSVHKDQPQMGLLRVPDSGSESYCRSESHKTSSLFSVPRLFVGFTPKGLSDCDSVKSPTSPLDFKLLPTVGANPPFSSPRSPHQKSWDRSRLGLSIVDTLDDDLINTSGKVPRPSESRNIIFGPGVRSKASNTNSHTDSPVEAAKSLPRNFAIVPRNSHTKSPLHKGSSDVLFEIGVAIDDPEPPFAGVRSYSLDSCRSSYPNLSSMNGQKLKPSSGVSRLSNLTTAQLNPPPVIIGASSSVKSSYAISTLSASEIELSEDYTCVISHGPNPKKTHIYGDCVLECHLDDLSNFGNNGRKEFGLRSWDAKHSNNPASFPSDHFLSFCHYCNKELEEGKDIYIYRGEKAFCSLSCRSHEMMIDGEFEEENDIDDTHGEVLEKTMNKSLENFLKLEEGNGHELSESSILYAP